MLKVQKRLPRRHLVSPDGAVWWTRALHGNRKLKGVYIPREVLNTLGWTDENILQVWIQGEVLCMRAMPDQGRVPVIKPQPPKSWKEHDRELHISIFQEVK
jgi:hypothetical protein